LILELFRQCGNYTFGTIPGLNIKIIERGKKKYHTFGTIPLTQLHDRPLSWLCTCTSIRSGGVKLVYLPKLNVWHYSRLLITTLVSDNLG
jgi:hypothetical protein